MANCSNCGAELKPAAKFCSECGAALGEVADVETVDSVDFSPPVQASPDVVRPAPVPPASASPRKIENHLVKSIIATLCCCIPFGVAGIVYAAKVDALLARGDYAAAEEAGKKAGMWSNLAIGVGFVVQLLLMFSSGIKLYYQYKEGVFQ